jgi:GTPase SAR1 family protein
VNYYKYLGVEIVDTPGRDLYHTAAIEIYKESKCAMIVFDASNETSFNNIKTKWLSNV